MFSPTPDEHGLIQKVRDGLGEASDWEDLKHDAFILRWLQAHDMDFEKTETALLESYKWRKENEMDKILKDYVPDADLVALFHYDVAGYDKENCPIICYDVQVHNPKKTIQKYGKEALQKFENYNLEKIAQVCRDKQTKETPVQQIIIICDAKKLTFKQMTSPGSTEMSVDQVKRLETHYPDALKLLVVVNAGKVIKIAYKIIKPYIKEKTLKKVKIFPKCNAKVKNLLLQYIDIDELPIKYGGNKKVGEEENICIIDEDDTENPDETDEMTEAKVPAGKKLKLEYQIDTPNTQICWTFQPEDREIGFTVYLGEKENTVFAHAKFAQTSLHTNSLTCEKTGKYTLCFDNKESRFRSTTLNYVISLVPPSPIDEEK